MIITLKGANFSTNNIGTLSTWSISRNLGTGATYSGATTVDKGAALNATVTIGTGYELGATGVTVTMGGNPVTSGIIVSGNTITISIPSVTGNVVIKVPTKNTATGEEGEPEIPDTPDTPTVQHPYASGATLPADGIVTQDMFVVLDNTWINSSGTTLDQILDAEATGNTVGYYCCYLPINISGYSSIDMTPQADQATYYQFFTTDGSWKLSGVRQKIDKGSAKTTVAIPSGAKYLLVAHSRTNLGTNKDQYGLYFPAEIKIY